MHLAGALYCLASAAAFGAMGVFGRLAYDEGATVGTLLSTRFVLAAALLWLLVVCTGSAGDLRALRRRDAGIALAVVVFAESLGPAQLAGGAMVLFAVLAVRTSQINEGACS